MENVFDIETLIKKKKIRESVKYLKLTYLFIGYNHIATYNI